MTPPPSVMLLALGAIRTLGAHKWFVWYPAKVGARRWVLASKYAPPWAA